MIADREPEMGTWRGHSYCEREVLQGATPIAIYIYKLSLHLAFPCRLCDQNREGSRKYRLPASARDSEIPDPESSPMRRWFFRGLDYTFSAIPPSCAKCVANGPTSEGSEFRYCDPMGHRRLGRWILTTKSAAASGWPSYVCTPGEVVLINLVAVSPWICARWVLFAIRYIRDPARRIYERPP